MTSVDHRGVIARLLTAKTTDEWIVLAGKHGLLREGMVDLSGRQIRFNHRNLDLRQFRLEGADLSGSQLINPQGEGALFCDCVLRKVKVVAEPGKRGCLRGAIFDGAHIEDTEFGPRTLDLYGASFRRAKLTRVTFRMGHLPYSSFERAHLMEVNLRSANLEQASFRSATLERTSLEKAVLKGTNFSDADFKGMEKWGEPNFEDAIIADDLRYRFGVVRDPVLRLEAVLRSGDWSDAERGALEQMIYRVRGFAAAVPEAMLIEDEYLDLMPAQLFRRVLKMAKQGN